MRKLLLLIAACCLLTTSLTAQELKKYAEPLASQSPKKYINEALQKNPATTIKAAGIFYNLGLSYSYLNQEEKAVEYLIKSKKLFEKKGMTSVAKDLSLEIHCVIASQEHYNKYSDNFLSEFYNYAKQNKSNHRLALAYNEFGKMDLDEWQKDSVSNPVKLNHSEKMFKTALQFHNKDSKPGTAAKIYHNLFAVFLCKGELEKARKYQDTAFVIAQKENNTEEIFTSKYSIGLIYFYEENYTTAISWFKQAEPIKLAYHGQKYRRILYKKMMESYDALNDQPNRRKYQKLYLDLEAKINDEQQNIAIHETEQKYNVQEKDKKISSLQEFKEKFYKNRLIFGILLFLVFLLALYSFVRWKKVDFYKKKLQKENQLVQDEKQAIEEIHQKTVEELEKVKSIVTEGYIVLKDNTKVYLADLMYVKAEDHYLNLYSKDEKKHFVRGKISQLIEELPPNFSKCHRSYIVNINFIQSYGRDFVILKNKEEIPTSRNFKF